MPWSILVGPDGRVVFSENEFDEDGFAAAVQRMYEPSPADTAAASPPRRRTGRRRTVVLGGGTGGIVAAHELRRRLPAGHDVILVDRSTEHVYRPSLLWQIVGERRPSQFTRPLDALRKRGIDVRQAEVEALDVEHGVVATTSGDLEYDSLVLALGAELATDEVPGFDEMAGNLYTPGGCARIHAALDRLDEGSVGVLVPSLPFACPAAPYEAAFLAEAFLRKRGIRRKVQIHLFTPEHAPMPVAPAALGDAVADMLAARGIEYHPLFTFQELRPETREVIAADGRSHAIDVLMCVPPHRAPEVVRSSPLVGVSGFVHVDARTLETGHPGVYAVGDVTTVKLPNGKALPKAGVFAHAEAKTVASRIAAAATGSAPDAAFAGKGYCWIELGDGRAAFAGGDFLARPEPRLRIQRPSRPLHWGKVAFERWWLHHWFR